jgi:23S rRNA pseudouridine2605 synthase
MTKPQAGERLQKMLAQAGVSSRRDAEKLIAAGRVKVDGRVVTTLGTRVSAEAKLEVDGREVQAQAPMVIVMNKPDGVVSTTESSVDERGRPTVVSLLRGVSARLTPVGRLDFHTRGVLLLTNDGSLAAALSHPRREVPKTYHAKFQGKLPESAIEQLHAGVELEDGTRTRPALEVEVVKATTMNTWVQITVGQGLYRQVRRMGDAIGHAVLKLIRVAYGGITATGLRDGEWRILREDEVEHLRRVAAGKATGPAPAPPERARPGKRGADEAAAKKPATATVASARARQAPADRPAIARPRPSGRTSAGAGARKAPAGANRAKRGAKAPSAGAKRARRP